MQINDDDDDDDDYDYGKRHMVRDRSHNRTLTKIMDLTD